MTDAHHLPNSVDAPLVDPEFIANKHRGAFVAASDVLRAAQDWPAEVNGPADLEVLTSGIRSATAAHKTLEAARSTEKRRFDDAGREVQGIFTPHLGKLDTVKQTALAAITRHNRQVEERQRQLAAEAAERERAEAQRRADAAAALEQKGLGDVAETVMETAVEAERMAEKLDRQSTGSAADLVRVHTGGGTVTSATRIAFEVVSQDILRAGLGVLGPHLAQPDIDKAIRSLIAAEKRVGKSAADIVIPGVRCFNDSTARVR